MFFNFECENFKSLREETFFSALASVDDTHEELVGKFDELRYLKTLLVYGPNGSGKTNLVDAMEYMKNLVLLNQVVEGEKLVTYPNKLVGNLLPSYFQMMFSGKNNVRYFYGFKIKDGLVVAEFLCKFPNGRKTVIFIRDINEGITEGAQYKGKFEHLGSSLKNNQLLLTRAKLASSLEDIDVCYYFFKDDLLFYRGNSFFIAPQGGDSNFWSTLKEMNENEKFKKGILEILNAIGIHVHDVVVEKKMIEPGSLSLMCMANPQNLLMSQYTHDYTAKLVYNDFSTNLISEESSGIQKLFSLFYPLYDAVKNDKVLICDELEAFLHPNLICKIVEIFSTVLSKESNAQLITTTHCLDVLNIKSLRRDQVYFTLKRRAHKASYFSARINARKVVFYLR